MQVIEAVPLAEAPDVTTFLRRLRLGTLTDDVVRSFPGRNDIWAGVTTTDTPVFVKRVTGEADARITRTAVMAQALRDHAVISTPRCLGVDRTARLVAFDLLEEAVTAAELIAVAGFSVDLAHQTGVIIGELHRLAPPDAIAGDTSEPPAPPVRGLDAIPLPVFLAASAAELEMWSILHTDRAVADAIRRLRERENRSARTVVHGDLRLDQLLRHRGELYLTDWEECRVADPARDVGAFVGECAYRAVMGMASARHTGDRDLTEDEVVSNGVREFELLVPLVEAFWEGYRQARPDHDGELALRSVAWAGWHMFDRAWASGRLRPRLSPLERAAAGVGRSALTDPAALTTTLGLGGGR